MGKITRNGYRDILIVDDDPRTRDVTARLLSRSAVVAATHVHVRVGASEMGTSAHFQNARMSPLSPPNGAAFRAFRLRVTQVIPARLAERPVGAPATAQLPANDAQRGE